MPDSNVGEDPLSDLLLREAHPFPADMEQMIRELLALDPTFRNDLSFDAYLWARGMELDKGREKLTALLALGAVRPSPGQAASLVRSLEMVARRPHMFFGTADVRAAQVFLMGFQVALLNAFRLDRTLWEKVILERGWELPKATGPGIEAQMLKRGMSAEEVIAELVEIEIDLVNRGSNNSG